MYNLRLYVLYLCTKYYYMRKIFVFFDGQCGVCAKEINYYQKKDKNSYFEWVDVNSDKDKLETYGISYNESLKILHVIDREGRIVTGIEAFLLIWKEFKYWKTFAKIINLKPVKYLVNEIYQVWAEKRYEKLKYKCDSRS
jgi:predicted DCC family thiol-disulfide oxidoreductase YuxK